MLIFLMHWLQDHFQIHIPQAFFYTSTRLILACVTSLAVSLFLGPFCIRKLYQLKIGQPIRDLLNDNGFLLGKLHKSKRDTPTMGGLLIIFSLLSSLVLWMDLSHPFTILLLIATLLFGFLGAYDDITKLKFKSSKGISPRVKLFYQGLIALLVITYIQIPAVQLFFQEHFHLKPIEIKEFIKIPLLKKQLTLTEYSSRIYFPCFKDPLIVYSLVGSAILWIFYAFIIVGCSNAVNLTDGLDGLAPGLIIFVGATLALFAFVSNHQEMADYLNILYIEGSGEVAIFLAAMCGSCLGFLWFNSHPAQVFMGDVGSLTLGGLLAISAILIRREFILALAGGIFLAEALSVIIQVFSYRYNDKKRVFLCAPLHHHFEYLGWAESKVVIRFWIIGFLLALLSLLTLKLQ